MNAPLAVNGSAALGAASHDCWISAQSTPTANQLVPTVTHLQPQGLFDHGFLVCELAVLDLLSW
jgi:hypothetical protein